jgi:hypothetical protein
VNMTDRVNAAFKALLSDDLLLKSFKKNPRKALRSFELLDCELDAIKLGDERALVAHGLDAELVVERVSSPHWFAGLFGTVARRMAAPAVLAVLLALSVQAFDAPTASAARANVRAGRRVGKIRAHGPLGLRRISLRTRARLNVRAVRARVREQGSYKRGLTNAIGQVGCLKCGSLPPTDGTK